MEINMESVVWEECISEKGVKYEIGYIGEAGTDKAPSNKQDFGVKCDWAPTEVESWKKTDFAFKGKTGIDSYSVNKHNSGGYGYIIHFQNVETYNYTFYDETGDHYNCNTFLKRSHWVRYNSNDPTIVFIKGS